MKTNRTSHHKDIQLTLSLPAGFAELAARFGLEPDFLARLILRGAAERPVDRIIIRPRRS